MARAFVRLGSDDRFLAVTLKQKVQRRVPVRAARQRCEIDMAHEIAQRHTLAILAEQTLAYFFGNRRAAEFGLLRRQIAKHHEIGKLVHAHACIAGAEPALDRGFEEQAHMLRHALPFVAEARFKRRQIEHVNLAGGGDFLVIGRVTCFSQ